MTNTKQGITQVRVLNCIRDMRDINNEFIERNGADVPNLLKLDFCEILFNYLKKSEDYSKLESYDVSVNPEGFVWAGGWLVDSIVEDFITWVENAYFY